LFSYILIAMISVGYVKHISWQKFAFVFKYSYSILLPAKQLDVDCTCVIVLFI